MRAISRFLKTALLLTVIVIGGAIVYAYSGYYDVSVGTGHNAVTHWYLATLRNNSIKQRAAELEVPALDNEEMIRAGAVSYDQGCAGCHGRPGREPSDSFDPRPPALTRYAHDPAFTFWVVRNGIKMSAMPARGEERMPDEQVWEVAAFLQDASRLTEGEYRELVEPEPEPAPEPAEDEASGTEEPEAQDAATEDNGGGEDASDGEQSENEDSPEDPPGGADNEDLDG